MKPRAIIVAALIAITAAIVPSASRSGAEPRAAQAPAPPSGDTVVARIGQKTYTLAEISKRLDRLGAAHRHALERRLPAFVDEVIRREALAGEARRLGLDRDPGIGLDIEDATQRILVREHFQREVVAHATPTPDEIRAYYREHEAEFRLPERAEVEQVAVRTEAEADTIRAAVQNGQSLKAAADAIAHARATVMTVVRGVREKEVDEVVFGLQPGALSAPVRGRQGLLIFQLRNRYPAQLQSLDAATPQVTRRLTAQNQERLWKALQDRVWRDPAVEVRDDVLKAAMPGSVGQHSRAADHPLSGALNSPVTSRRGGSQRILRGVIFKPCELHADGLEQTR